jgi:hypothetical protein
LLRPNSEKQLGYFCTVGPRQIFMGVCLLLPSLPGNLLCVATLLVS